DKRSKTGYRREKRTVHRVQVLDPATGTGTFLAEVVRQVHAKFKGQEGLWPQYVEQHLIPRLNGFELLMASYAMAHLKLDLVLRETGYDMGRPHGTPNAQPTNKEQQRLRVFLTNSLEEAHPDTGTLFASWLSQEANEANAVKRDTPVMVVLGNPPYAVSSSNRGEWIQNAIKDYKEGLGERKLNLDDDYIKFIRYGQHLIDRTGEGILAYITNSSFIDGITHRQMRRSLLKSFNSVYILDLHGSTLQEDMEDTGDENVFDIQQGVSINLFIKRPGTKKKEVGIVRYYELIGRRREKYEYLATKQIGHVPWKNLELEDPYWFFVPKDFGLEREYQRGVKLTDLMPVNSSGIETKCDGISVHHTEDSLAEVLNDFRTLSSAEVRLKYGHLKEESSGWNYDDARKDIQGNNHQPRLISYRPFDMRWTILPETSGGFIGRSRYDVMRHFVDGQNVGLLAARQTAQDYRHVFITHHPTDGNYTSTAKKLGSAPVFPLYLYPAINQQTSTLQHGMQPNLDVKLVEQLAKDVGLTYSFKPEALFEHGRGNVLLPLDVLDYCYAVLHSAAYRAKYKEFLKIDFPR
ncbi:MAG TPA: DNA methyltransferase, partial [Flavobacteriales bacterium]|nr:DNA methyltransferase [Flavobacteriales bacterium]